MDADRIEKACTGLERHGNGICQAKDGSICPYWSIGATCSMQMTSDAIFVIRGLLAENKQLKDKRINAEKRIEKLIEQHCYSSNWNTMGMVSGLRIALEIIGDEPKEGE